MSAAATRLSKWIADHRLTALLGLGVAILAKNALVLCRDKAYAIDEFHYVHKAWMALQPDDGLFAAIGRGEAFVPSMLCAPFAALGGDDPATMLYVRLSMLIGLALCLFGVAILAGIEDPGSEPRLGVALLAPLLLLADPIAMKHLVEVRPDCVAIALLIAALAMLRWRRPGDRVAAAAAGLLVCAACFSSLKSAIVGAGLGPVFAVDLIAWRRGRPQVLRSAPAFAIGFAAGVVAVLAVVVSVSSLDRFWYGYYGIIAFHEAHYAAISLERFLEPYILRVWPVLLLAACGVVLIAAAQWRRWRAERALGPDVLIALFWLGAWASFLIQKAAYPYSLIPISVTSAILAARALGWVGAALLVAGDRRAAAVAVVALAGVVALGLAGVKPKHDNDGQIAVQRQIGELTAVDDAAYDLSGSFVYRPRGHRFVFVDKSRRTGMRAEINREVPRSLVERQVVLFVWDVRFAASWRKSPMGKFILEHYQPLSWELFFWGRKLAVDPERPRSFEFLAIKTGRYFVHPAAAAPRVRIDGEPLARPIAELEAGTHDVAIAGAGKPEDVYLIWLPRNGVPFDPTRYRWYGAGRNNALARWILP